MNVGRAEVEIPELSMMNEMMDTELKEELAYTLLKHDHLPLCYTKPSAQL